MPGKSRLRRNTAWQTTCSRLIGLLYGHSNNELFDYLLNMFHHQPASSHALADTQSRTHKW